tara:strand:- start:837 stop:1703 length:867 start_codon:yes stop_codon:yes gene_type:complete
MEALRNDAHYSVEGEGKPERSSEVARSFVSRFKNSNEGLVSHVGGRFDDYENMYKTVKSNIRNYSDEMDELKKRFNEVKREYGDILNFESKHAEKKGFFGFLKRRLKSNTNFRRERLDRKINRLISDLDEKYSRLQGIEKADSELFSFGNSLSSVVNGFDSGREDLDYHARNSNDVSLEYLRQIGEWGESNVQLDRWEAYRTVRGEDFTPKNLSRSDHRGRYLEKSLKSWGKTLKKEEIDETFKFTLSRRVANRIKKRIEGVRDEIDSKKNEIDSLIEGLDKFRLDFD